MINNIKNKLINFLKVKPIVNLGDVWKTKPDGWVGTVQKINEYVITSYNLEENSIRVVLRKYCKYDLKNKVITCDYHNTPFDDLSHAIDGNCITRLVTLEDLTNNLIKTDDNFLEIDALLGE